jgi:O-methyltransferase|tara:strand:- start:8611 stop:9276 length:666 start_codon:yes stop_codon:yes gene_type:complete
MYLEVIPNHFLWMGKNQRRVFFRLLRQVIKRKVSGAILEVGVAEGHTSAFIARVMRHLNCKKEFHVYDSFKGMPAPSIEDGEDNMLSEGDLAVKKGKYKCVFRNMTDGELPIIHEGWIENTMPEELPEKIAFAYIDVDFYKPTLHALNSIYPRLSPGAVVVIDDYHHPQLPGIAPAVERFFADKPEEFIVIPPCEDYTDNKSQAYFIKAQSHQRSPSLRSA